MVDSLLILFPCQYWPFSSSDLFWFSYSVQEPNSPYRYVREETVIYCLFLVAINKSDTAYQTALICFLKISKPSLQVQRHQQMK